MGLENPTAVDEDAAGGTSTMLIPSGELTTVGGTTQDAAWGFNDCTGGVVSVGSKLPGSLEEPETWAALNGPASSLGSTRLAT